MMTDWYDKWDALYWNFVNDNREILKKIYAIAMQVKLLDKMEPTRLSNYIKIAKEMI